MKLGEVCEQCEHVVTKEHRTPDGSYVDPCLGILPGVKFGCCGHGRKAAYLFFENGRILRFEEGLSVSEQQIMSIHNRFIK